MGSCEVYRWVVVVRGKGRDVVCIAIYIGIAIGIASEEMQSWTGSAASRS